MFLFFIDESNEAWDMNDVKDVCILCDRKVRRTKGKNQKVATSTSEDKMNQIVKILEKENRHEKIDQIQDAYTVSYHPNCFFGFELQTPDYSFTKKVETRFRIVGKLVEIYIQQHSKRYRRRFKIQ